MNHSKGLMVMALGAIALVAGCVSGDTPSEKFQSRMRADAAPLSDFLPHHELLVRQPNHFPFHYFYLKNDTRSYKYVYVAPVDMSKLRESSSWAELDKSMMGKLSDSVDELGVFARKAYIEAFRKASQAGNRLEPIARRDRPGTLVIEPALVAVVPTKAELAAAGVAANFVFLGASAIATTLGAGSITVECRVRDAKTGEIVAMYGDTEKDPKAIIPIAQLTWSSSAKINLKEIARQTAAVLSAKDYREIRRKFPIQLISTVKDSNLDGESSEKK